MRTLNEITSRAPRLCLRATPKTSPPCPKHPQPSLSKVPRWPLQQADRATRRTIRETFLVHVARVENLLHDVELMVVVLGGLGQLRSDVEFLVRIESQASCVRGFELFRE
jgi:hypothetical protein